MVVHIDPSGFNRTCPRCQATVHGTDPQTCPECGGSMVPNCMACGYDLAGLPRQGACPECGTPVERSYAPDMLENRSPEFLTSLHSGFRLVYFGLIGMLCLTVLTVIALIAVGMVVPSAESAFRVIASFLNLGVSLIVLLGWWRVTTPDPGRIGGGLDVRPRQVLRVTLSVGLAVSLAVLGLEPFVRSGRPSLLDPLSTVVAALQLLALIVWAVQFFTAMLYFRWLARRIPDHKLEADAKRFMWLGPVLFIVFYVCLLIGPLIALVMYLRMLSTLRKDIAAILTRLGAL